MAPVAAVVFTGCSREPAAPPAPAPPALLAIAEGLPEARLATLRERDAIVAKARLSRGQAPMAVLDLTRRWAPGETVTVAFFGGTPRLHRQIAQAAAMWTLHANVGLDFGGGAGSTLRAWSPADTAYTAQIRIGFAEPGYFSCVGNDSVDAACATPQQASMNFARFDRALPSNWEAIVLHEFGHALVLQHEHQSAAGQCDAEFRWENDPGYVATRDGDGGFVADGQGRRPGIYQVLGGPPNGWSRAIVDFNLRQLPDSRAFTTTPFDPQSIMKYDFPEWMYVSGRASRCFSTRNDDLSALDRQGIGMLYPRAPADVLAAVRERQGAAATLRDASAIPEEIRRQMRDQLDVLRGIR
jgi:hypothetical protein